MDPLSRDDVRKVARLARLAVDDARVDRLRTDLAAVLGYVERLRTLDLAAVEPLTHLGDDDSLLRDDEPGQTLSPGCVGRLAPESFVAHPAHDDGTTQDDTRPPEQVFIRVPKVLGDGGGA